PRGRRRLRTARPARGSTDGLRRRVRSGWRAAPRAADRGAAQGGRAARVRARGRAIGEPLRPEWHRPRGEGRRDTPRGARERGSRGPLATERNERGHASSEHSKLVAEAGGENAVLGADAHRGEGDHVDEGDDEK